MAALLVLSACKRVDYSPTQTCLLENATLASAGPGARFVPGEVLVTFKPAPQVLGVEAASVLRDFQLGSLAADNGLAVATAMPGSLPSLLTTGGDPEGVAAALRTDPRVEHAEPNWIYTTQAEFDCVREQWNFSRFGVADAIRVGPGRHGATVAVIDSGVDVDHPELTEAMLPGYNFVDNIPDPRPGSGGQAAHGTHVAGIIASRGAAGPTGVAGFPGQVKVLPIRIFDDAGVVATFADLVTALTWAVGLERIPGVPDNPYPADIVNLSLGGGVAQNAMLNDIVSRVTQAGVLVIAAAGNDVPGILSPANGPDALAVGSVDSDFRLSDFSAWGGSGAIGITAPGGYGPSSCGTILSTLPNGLYGCSRGTSMAAPYVAGAAALLLTHEPGLGPQELAARIASAAYFDSGFMDGARYGAGILCADRLLGARSSPSSQLCGY